MANKIFSGLLCTLCAQTLLANSYGFSSYYFADPHRGLHAEGGYRNVLQSDFENHRRGHLHYSDASASAFYTQALNEDNMLSYGLGYDFLGLHWDHNPRFKDRNFHYFEGSLGYISTALDQWRWIVNAGFSVNAERFDFGPSGVYHALLWGKYDVSDRLGIHVGALGWYGVRHGRGLPLLGFNFRLNDHWSGNAIFPWDYSLTYAFDDHWTLEGAFSSFGGPYKYPRRAYEGVRPHSHDPIFMVYANGVDLALKYRFEHLLRASLAGGWNFGGWVLIQDHRGHHGKYYHFGAAPYIQASVALTF